MRLIICILLLLVSWQPLMWAGASSVETSLSLEKEANISSKKEARKALRLKKTPKKPKLQKKQGDYKLMVWTIVLFSVLSVLGMVGFGIGLGAGIAWLLWSGFGVVLFYLVFGFINMAIHDDWEELTVLFTAMLANAIFGLVMIVLGFVFSVVWVWVVGLVLFFVVGGLLVALFNAFK
jgi:cation transport ATPase